MKALMPLFTLLGALFMFVSALAAPGRTTYQAKIIKPDGLPLESSNVSFRFTVLDPSASCVLYVENYTAINMADGGGLVSFSLGMGTRAFPVSGTSSTFSNTFDNSVGMFNCQTTGTYNPSLDDNRKIVMQFNDGTGWQTLPAMAINAVPYAMYAGKSDNSIQFNGKSDSAFVEYSTLAGLSCAADQAIKFNGVSFSCITVTGGGGGVSSVTTSGTVLSTGGTASAPVISIQAATVSQDGYLTSLDYAEFKGKLSASSTQITNTLGYAPVSGAAVATQINNSNLSGDVSGTIASNSVVSVGGKTSVQISASVSDTQAATASATADTIVKRNSSGNATFNDVYANATKINYADIYRPSTSFNIRLQAPTSLSTNYILNLPTTSGTTGQVLSTDGAGNLSWINSSTGSVVSVSATAPLASTGGSTPTISITQATSSANGYLSSADWNTFNNKQVATSAAIIATLGYTPANDTASGTYLVKANNLSDLTNVVTARANLGLGTFATASSIDLGSASATGTLAIARIPSFTGDATVAGASNTIVLSNSGVTAGVYTKVTVDGKGRVTSSSALASSDVTTALGYTPASASASTQWTTSGTGIYYDTGNVGVGTTGPSSLLEIAGINSNADLRLTRTTNTAATSEMGTLTFRAPNASGTYLNWAQERVIVENATAGSEKASMAFNTQNSGSLGERMRIDSAGNVGIGTTTPTAKLHLAAGTASMAPLKFTSGTLLSSAQSGTMEYDGFNFYLTDSTNTRRTIATGSSAGTIDNASNINSSGNITMTPTGSVVVSSTTASTNSSTGALVVKGGLGVAGDIYTSGTIVTSSNIQGVSVTATSGMISPYIYGSTASGGALTLDSTTHSTKGKILLAPDGGNVGIGTAAPGAMLHLVTNNADDSGGIRLERTSATTGRYNQYISAIGDLTFSETAVGTRLTLQKTTGNVGIGTTSPLSPLQVAMVSGAGTPYVAINQTGDNPYLEMQRWSGASTPYAATRVKTYNDGSLAFETAPQANIGSQTFTERMRIGQTGNVGIGTTVPSASLDVIGGIRTADATNPFVKLSKTNATAKDWYLQYNTVGTAGIELRNGTDSITGLRITDGGNVGIGTTSPGAKLHIGGGDIQIDSGSKLIVNGSFGGNNYLYSPATASPRLGIFAGGAEKISINYADGNVGIGTTSPSYPLDVQSSGSFQARLFHSSNNQYDGSALMMSRTRGTLSSNTAVTSGDTIGGIYFRAHDGAGTGTTNSSVEVSAGENHSGTNRGTYMIFETTTNGSASRSEKMRIHSNGNVGIGTTTPGYKLSAYDSAAITANVESGGSGTAAMLRIAGKTSGTVARSYLAGINISDSNGNYEIYDQTAGASRLYVGSTGNVGIGTTSPSIAIDAVGSVRSAPVAVATTVTSINWSSGNIQYTPDSCQAYTFNNIADGAAYTFVVKGGTSATCSFTLYSGNGSGALTGHYTPALAATTASTHTVFTFFRAGNDVYMSWTSGL